MILPGGRASAGLRWADGAAAAGEVPVAAAVTVVVAGGGIIESRRRRAGNSMSRVSDWLRRRLTGRQAA